MSIANAWVKIRQKKKLFVSGNGSENFRQIRHRYIFFWKKI